MGQPITVLEKPSSNPAILRIETNRPLTGMGHERYTEAPDELRNRPVDELARRLFDTGHAASVHVYSNVITVDLTKGSTADGMGDVINELFIYYRPGVVPPTDEELMAQAPE